MNSSWNFTIISMFHQNTWIHVSMGLFVYECNMKVIKAKILGSVDWTKDIYSYQEREQWGLWSWWGKLCSRTSPSSSKFLAEKYSAICKGKKETLLRNLSLSLYVATSVAKFIKVMLHYAQLLKKGLRGWKVLSWNSAYFEDGQDRSIKTTCPQY